MTGIENEEDYFNNLSQQPPGIGTSESYVGGNADQPKAKRIACVLCRKRKLRCDGVRPACGTCTRLSHDCSYDEVRKKSGPKRGYVKLLEARLQQVETMLKDHSNDVPTANETSQPTHAIPTTFMESMMGEMPPLGPSNSNILGHGVDVHHSGRKAEPKFGRVTDSNVSKRQDPLPTQTHQTQQQYTLSNDNPMPDDFNVMDITPSLDISPSLEQTFTSDTFSWEMIGLGLEEPLPLPHVIEELHQIYFDKIHGTLPFLHRGRYLAAMNLLPNLQPPVCFRYMIWCHAAMASEKYSSLADIFYSRARKYIHADELRGHGEQMLSLAHCQTWCLVSLYEFKCMYFPRAWMSTGRACKASQMMMLHRLDGVGLDVKQCLPPPKDWTEREERRRTFWTAFCADRYASIGTGWPMTMDEKDILTNLPASEEAYQTSMPEPTPSLEQALSPSGSPRISPFSGVIMMASMFGRNLHHLHRGTPNDDEGNPQGPFWQRHHALEGLLSNISLTLPNHLRLPMGIPDTNIIFLNMAIQTSAICLHQAAIFKADRHRLPQHVSAESRMRCVSAAVETARLMKMICHIDLTSMHPFLAFSLYVAARVFIQYLKFKSNDTSMRSSLVFLLQAMHILKRSNSLTESFLVQLDVDLESAGIDIGNFDSPGAMPIFPNCSGHESITCIPLFDVRDGKADPAAVNGSFREGGRISSVSSDSPDPRSPTDELGASRKRRAKGNAHGTFGDGNLKMFSAETPIYSLPSHTKPPLWTPSVGAGIINPSDSKTSLSSYPQSNFSGSRTASETHISPGSQPTPPSEADNGSASNSRQNTYNPMFTRQGSQPHATQSPLNTLDNLPTPNLTDSMFADLGFDSAHFSLPPPHPHHQNNPSTTNKNKNATTSAGPSATGPASDAGPLDTSHLFAPMDSTPSTGMIWEVSQGTTGLTPGSMDDMSWAANFGSPPTLIPGTIVEEDHSHHPHQHSHQSTSNSGGAGDDASSSANKERGAGFATATEQSSVEGGLNYDPAAFMSRKPIFGVNRDG